MIWGFVVSGFFALGWIVVTVGNGLLFWQKWVRREESGSFVPFAGLLLGWLALAVFPLGTVAERMAWAWVPVVLDVGVLMWTAFLGGALVSKVRSLTRGSS